MDTINLAGIVRESITDGPGIRFAVFCQGCTHHCPGCHNEETWAIGGGKDVTIDKIMEEIKKDPILSGVTFSGGEPFLQAEGFLELAKRIKSETKLNIMIFTGFLIEELKEKDNDSIKQLISLADYIVDGKFVLAQKDLTLKYRGSSNQRIIDVKESIKNHKLMLAKEYMV
ncbi:MAG: anaerobic ribonucleoside-triphosphate reductase activating protein [Anaerovoracaceae bacterium]